jgi:membrane associated rhomboid family serine protease
MTLAIIAFTVVISLLGLRDQRIFQQLVFEPFTIHARKDWFRFVTHAFLHAHIPHLAINMFVLWSFGTVLERSFGTLLGMSPKLPFMLLYLGGTVFAALPSYKRHLYDPGYRAVGASGAVSAVLFATILLFPMQKLYIFGIIPMTGIVFGPLYLAYEYYLDKKGEDNVAHDAHFYGALFGLGFMTILRPSLWADLLHQIGLLR